MRSKRTFVVVMMLISAISIGVGVAASMFIKSPAQREAEVAPPPVTVLTEPVAFGVVEQSVAAPVRIGHASTTVVTVAAGTVITRLPTPSGEQAEAGSVVAEISGRPAVALPGAVPQYRDIEPGASGEDVTQLVSALNALGHSIEETTFGPAAQKAVTEVYEALGYAPTRRGDDEASAAQDALDQARRTVREAERGVDSAEVALERARRPLAEGGDEVARKDAIADAKRSLTVAQDGLADARRERDKASEASTTADAAAGVVIPLGEIVFVPAFPATVELSVGLGPSSGGQVLSLTSGPLVAFASLAEGEAEPIAVGQKAQIILDGAEPAEATVTATTKVSTKEEDSDEPVVRYEVVLSPTQP